MKKVSYKLFLVAFICLFSSSVFASSDPGRSGGRTDAGWKAAHEDVSKMDVDTLQTAMYASFRACEELRDPKTEFYKKVKGLGRLEGMMAFSRRKFLECHAEVNRRGGGLMVSTLRVMREECPRDLWEAAEASTRARGIRLLDLGPRSTK